MTLLDIKGAAAILADHLTQNGAPIAQELLEAGLAKLGPILQDRETQALDALKADVSVWIAALIAAGETHQIRILADDKPGTVARWEAIPK